MESDAKLIIENVSHACSLFYFSKFQASVEMKRRELHLGKVEGMEDEVIEVDNCENTVQENLEMGQEKTKEEEKETTKEGEPIQVEVEEQVNQKEQLQQINWKKGWVVTSNREGNTDNIHTGFRYKEGTYNAKLKSGKQMEHC